MGGGVKPYQPPPTPAGRINTTDHDSRTVKTKNQPAIQGYNAQAAVNEHHIVLAAEITVDSPDFGHLEPVVRATRRELRDAGVSESPGVVLADPGYRHQRQMEHIVERGIQVLIPPDSRLRKDARPGWDKGLYAFMRRVLATDHGEALYRKRQSMVEPVFAQIKFNRRIDRFQRRGRSAARSEWRLAAATHNLLKLHNHRTAAVGARNSPQHAPSAPPRDHEVVTAAAAALPHLFPTATRQRGRRLRSPARSRLGRDPVVSVGGRRASARETQQHSRRDASS